MNCGSSERNQQALRIKQIQGTMKIILQVIGDTVDKLLMETMLIAFTMLSQRAPTKTNHFPSLVIFDPVSVHLLSLTSDLGTLSD